MHDIKDTMQAFLQYISYVPSDIRHSLITTLLHKMGIPYAHQVSRHARNIILFPENYSHGYNMIFTAHYDIVPGSCGANDNGAAIVILLMIARHLVQNPDKNIMIAFLDREETGGIGCEMFLKNYKAGLIVNMDVCGCGDKIVICDETSVKNTYALYFRSTMLQSFMESDAFPYCDGRHAERMGFDVWSISVFPEKDAVRMSEKRMTAAEKERICNHEPDIGFLYKYLVHSLDINKYMHCGIYDDIKYINYDIMAQIYSYILCTISLMETKIPC